MTVTVCPKCGFSGEPRLEWHPGIGDMVMLNGGRIDVEGEHLHYSCSRCSYDWTGPTLDGSA